jgi:hypothetical protein
LRQRAVQELGGATDPDKVTLPPYYPRDPVLLRDWAAYLDAVRFTDQQVGQVIARLEKEGILDQTLVLFMTDHGISHARGKQFLYNEGTHVPLVARGPGVPKGRRAGRPGRAHRPGGGDPGGGRAAHPRLHAGAEHPRPGLRPARRGVRRPRPLRRDGNILFIFSDDHAQHAISAYGSKVNQTPHLDRLARGRRAFTNSFVTNSICTPSRATLLTGQYSHLNGVPVFNRFDGSRDNVAKHAAGRRLPHRHDRQVAPGQRSHRLRPLDRLPGQGAYNDPQFLVPGKQADHQGHCTDITTELGIEF